MKWHSWNILAAVVWIIYRFWNKWLFYFFLIFQNTLHLKFRSSYMEEVKSSYSKHLYNRGHITKKSKGPAQWTIYFNDVQYKIPLPLETLESPI